jgi:hypothetical protein
MNNTTTGTDKPKAKSIGGLWKYTSKIDQQEYWNGNITIDGVEYPINVYANSYKKQGEKSPDFRIFAAKPRQNAAPTQPQTPKTFTPRNQPGPVPKSTQPAPDPFAN